MIRQFIWLEPGLIFALILANGFFAAAEIAIIATRKSRIDALLEKGVKAAFSIYYRLVLPLSPLLNPGTGLLVLKITKEHLVITYA